MRACEHHVFLSYSHMDKEIMWRVRSTLEAEGLKVWTDEGIALGTSDWMHSVESAIKTAGCFVVILTPHAHESEWVRKEIGLANIHKLQHFPLVASGTDEESIGLQYAISQRADIRNSYAEEMKKVISAIKHHLKIDSQKSSLIDKPSRDFGNNWVGVFFANTNLTGNSVTCSQIPSLNFDWRDNAPVVNGVAIPGIDAHLFSARFTGTQIFTTTGIYIFNVSSKDGVRVFLNGGLVLDRFVPRSYTTDTLQIALNAGPVLMVVEYFNTAEQGSLSFSWTLSDAPVMSNQKPSLATQPNALNFSNELLNELKFLAEQEQRSPEEILRDWLRGHQT